MLSELITVDSKLPIEVIDITPQAEAFVAKQSVQKGLLVIQSLHTTSGIRINEKCKELEKDLYAFLGRLAPPQAGYAHDRVAGDGRPNTHSHLLSYLLGSSETLMVEKGKLLLGTWQRLFFIELDGPRAKRSVRLTLIY